MKPRLIPLLAFLLAAHVCGCASHRPQADARLSAGIQAPAVGLDSANVVGKHQVKTGPLSGIARVFSTPAGIERRQAVRLAKAAAGPKKLGKGAVYAPAATQVANSYKSKAATVAAADSATVQVATNAVAGHDNTATQTATTKEAPGITGTLKRAALGVAVLAGLYFFWPVLWPFLLSLRPRRRNDTQA